MFLKYSCTTFIFGYSETSFVKCTFLHRAKVCDRLSSTCPRPPWAQALGPGPWALGPGVCAPGPATRAAGPMPRALGPEPQALAQGR